MTSPRTTSSCRRCGQIKPVEEFWSNPRISTGLSSWCKDCHRKASRESRQIHGDRYNATRRKPKELRECADPLCHQTFEAANNKRFCSKRCKKRVENSRRTQTKGPIHA